ncbi:Alcohol dehydrogenase superfamily, zinc-type [Corchorus capsularis]|uniref:Alcohol dehydrogenase superfamily, zinc-type n=1 Tax=Corchorus capsularis TaxID=210143 RepID=A0A1R3JI07_COCAP|nr:Alcohol dehydrogenase superfamily, zinc-type [Corchorus capsularis]
MQSVVESVGENVWEVEEGDMVVPVFHPNCRECRDCKSPKGNHCLAFGNARLIRDMSRDKTSRFKDMNGEVLHHFLYVSSFTQYTVVDVANVVKISPQIPSDKACLLSCGVSTGVGAAWKVADIEENSTVAIFGLGAVGLAVVEGARLRGASKIIGVDLNPEKEEIGKQFGVTDFINPSTCGDKKVSEGIANVFGYADTGLASSESNLFFEFRSVLSNPDRPIEPVQPGPGGLSSPER